MAMPLSTEVYLLTGRPDLVAQTDFAIKSILLEVHKRDTFPNDRKEILIDLVTTGRKVAGPLPANYRHVEYVRSWPTSSIDPTEILTLIQPSQVMTSLGGNFTDVFYIAGTHLNALLSKESDRLLLGYYALPDLSEAGAAVDWVALRYPEMIIHGAAAKVLGRIGFREEANVQRAEFQNHLETFWSAELYGGALGVQDHS